MSNLCLYCGNGGVGAEDALHEKCAPLYWQQKMTAVNKDELREVKGKKVWHHDSTYELARFIVEYEFRSPEAMYSNCVDLTEYYKALIDQYITAQLTSLIERVETAIPKEHENTDAPEENLNAQECGEVLGYNNAIEVVNQALATIKQELIEGSNK